MNQGAVGGVGPLGVGVVPPVSSSASSLPLLPVTVVTGAVGSGKSRLIESMLRNRSSSPSRVAVIECRFAVEIGCETVYRWEDWCVLHVEAMETQEHLCICCTPREEFLDALRGIASMRSSLDHLVIETTGLADPAMLKPLVEGSHVFEVVSVVCVVDCASFGLVPPLCASGDRSIEYEQIVVSSAVVFMSTGDPTKDAFAWDTVRTLPMYSARAVLLDHSQQEELVRQSFWGCGAAVAWTVDNVLRNDPHYFMAEVPWRRHQTHLSCVSLINLQELGDMEFQSLCSWAVALPAGIRVKGSFFLTEGVRKLVDGFSGGASSTPLLIVDGKRWKASEQVPVNKLVLVGPGVEPEQLKSHLQLVTGLKMHPTVLYSAPPPVVDTPLQRVAICIILLGIIAFSIMSPWGGGAMFKWASLFAVLIYTYLSVKK